MLTRTRTRTRPQISPPQANIGRTLGGPDQRQRTGEPYRIRITTDEERYPSLGNISIFLWDIVLLHDRLALALLGAPAAEVCSQRFMNRRARQLLVDEHKLRLSVLTKDSPLIAEVVLGLNLLAMGIGLGWGLLKVWEKVRDIQIKGQQLENLRLENERIRRELGGTVEDVSSNFRSGKYMPVEKEDIERQLTRDLSRLASNQDVRIIKVEVVEYR